MSEIIYSHARSEGSPDDGNGIFLGKLSTLRDALEQFSSDGQHKSKVILRTRLKPLIKLHLCGNAMCS